MANKDSGTFRPIPEKKKQKKDDFTTLVEASGFVMTMGLLITATGMICYMSFRNLIGMYFLDAGLILCLFAFGVKLLDLFLKIIGARE